MLMKIIFKNFMNNLKNYLLFFLSNTLAVLLLLVFWGTKINLGKSITDEGIAYALNMDFMIAIIMMAIIAVLLTVYAVQHYVRLRIQDYSMLKLLGIRKGTFQNIILAEYGLGWGLSVLVGLLGGNIVYYIFQEVLYHINPTFLAKSNIGMKAYIFTVMISIVIVLIVVLTTLTIMDGKSLDTFAAGKEVKESKPNNKKWSFVVLIGVILFGIGNYRYPIGDGGIFYAHILWLIALFLILSIGGSLLLEWLKHRKKFYFRNLIRLNQLCHHYSSNYLVIFIMFVIHFFALGYLANEFAGCFPISVNRNLYPYDYIWAAQEKDKEYIEKTAENYKGTAKIIPIIRVASLNQLDQFGISASTYYELTGEKCNVADGEIVVLVESTEKGKEINDKGYDLVYGAVHIGKSKGDNVSVDNYELYGFQKANIKKIVTGNIVGQLLDGWRENWIIMSDHDFNQYHENIVYDEEEPSILALYQIPNQYRQRAGKELRRYATEHGVAELGELQNNYYDVGNIINGIQARLLFSFSSKLFLIITLLFSGTFILAMKAMSDETAMMKRYTFLRCMGMRQAQRVKSICFEIRSIAVIPLIAGIVMSVNYAIVNIKRVARSGEEVPAEFWHLWSIVLAVYILIQLLGIEVSARITAKKIEKAET